MKEAFILFHDAKNVCIKMIRVNVQKSDNKIPLNLADFFEQLAQW